MLPYWFFPFSLTLAPSASAALADGKSPLQHAVASRSAGDGEADDDMRRRGHDRGHAR